jgi:3-deoxy-manno-octulosonate cytidylyltransferase (CMP-KDO synthetase)
MKFTVIIPARHASTRLPAKPLMDIGGKPMIQHVYERAIMSAANRVVIATDHADIEIAAKKFGAEVVMTALHHESGTDRLHEVVAHLGYADDDIVVNVQGDEPLIPPAVIDQVAALIAAHDSASVATLCEQIVDASLLFDPNVVKVVFDHYARALYFSRAPIPWSRDTFVMGQQPALPATAQYYRHIGIYAYRVSLLQQFVTWPVSALERTEKLEQLRAMENGAEIRVAQACAAIPGGVDTAADLERVRHWIAQHRL